MRWVYTGYKNQLNAHSIMHLSRCCCAAFLLLLFLPLATSPRHPHTAVFVFPLLCSI
ncbi:MAG: hypothetical protein ACKERG_00075 [Candidatus Hodgkinia cicadicola]